MNTELQLTPGEKAVSLAMRPAEPSVGLMLQAVIERGVTADNVEALGKLADLYERVQAREAEKAFAEAFVAFQADMPTIVAKSVIPNRGKYERFEDLMEVVGPLLTKHGFVATFSMDFKENRILETCHLTHIGGHSRSNSFAVRASGKADSETQADCKAATTAKRNALCNALNIVIRQDVLNEEHDASIEGGLITAEQADELDRRVAETNSNKVAFLKFAQAPTFKEIRSGMYPVLDDMLRKKERGAK
jgi:CRISPR/Cas system CSM-associated protein Csm2 small subunit